MLFVPTAPQPPRRVSVVGVPVDVEAAGGLIYKLGLRTYDALLRWSYIGPYENAPRPHDLPRANHMDGTALMCDEAAVLTGADDTVGTHLLEAVIRAAKDTVAVLY